MPIRFPVRVTPTRLVATIAAAAIAGGVALAAFASDDAPAAPPPPPGHHHPPMMMGGLMLPRGPMLDHLLDQVDASAQQRSQVHRISDSMAAGMEAGRAAAHADHEQLLSLFAQPVVDAAAVEAVRQRMLARHDADSRLAMQAMLQLSQVLTPEQRTRLQALEREARAHHRPPMDGGPGAAPTAPVR